MIDLPADSTGNDWYPISLGIGPIIFIAAGSVFIVSGMFGACITYYFEYMMTPEIQDLAKRLHDNQINYPRCSVASQEQGLKIITPWKDYFTREDKPFVTSNPLP